MRDSQDVEELDFSLRCDDFELTYYPNSNRPKDYKIKLTVIEGGKEVLSKVIEVNDPLQYKGSFFYQSSYGTLPDRGSVLLRVTPRNSGQSQDYRVQVGQNFRIGDTEDKVSVNRFLPDFSIDSNGRAFSRSRTLNNPAIQLTVAQDGKEMYRTWVFSKFRDFHKKEDQEYNFELVRFLPSEYTGIQATKDPGVWVVWIGCILMCLGIYVVFFTSHQRIWCRVEEKNGSFKITLAGSSNKDQVAFSGELEQLYKNMKS
jgi:cytochrome c biogenesis protein